MKVNVLYHGARIAQLAEDQGKIFFQYDVSWLKESIELSPYAMPGSHKLYEGFTKDTDYVPALIVDSLPDSYGREIIKSHFRKQSIRYTALNVLSFLGQRTMGALTYEPMTGTIDDNKTVDLIKASTTARSIINHQDLETFDTTTLIGGVTAGGARPKLLVAIDDKNIVTGSDTIPKDMLPYLLKLDTKKEGTDNFGILEYVYNLMAHDAGLNIPKALIVNSPNGNRHFCVRRFDRYINDSACYNGRVHTASYTGLTGAPYSSPDIDYLDMMRMSSDLTANFQDLIELYKLMVFNLLSHNHDDHGKNFSWLMDSKGKWSFAPAYDLAPAYNELGGNQLLINGKRGNITKSMLIDVAKEFLIPERQTIKIIERTQSALSKWPELAKENGLPVEEISKLQSMINSVSV